MSNLALTPGTRLRTGGTTYEVLSDATVPANIVPVVPQTTRLLKVFCATCGYVARVTQRWVTKAGTPICPCNHKPMEVAEVKEKPATPDKPEAVKAVKVKPSPAPATEPEPEPLDLDDLDETPEPEPEPTSGPSPLAQLIADLPHVD